jgi:hypothetical protein
MVIARSIADVVHPIKMNYEIHGNTVPHLHLHLFPRQIDGPYVGRPIDPRMSVFERSDAEIEALALAIRAAIASRNVPPTAGWMARRCDPPRLGACYREHHSGRSDRRIGIDLPGCRLAQNDTAANALGVRVVDGLRRLLCVGRARGQVPSRQRMTSSGRPGFSPSSPVRKSNSKPTHVPGRPAIGRGSPSPRNPRQSGDW